MRHPLAGFLLVVALAVAACGGPAAPPAPDGTAVEDTEPEHEDDAEAPEPAWVADWSGPFTIELTNGWRVEHCDGDAPMWCVVDGDRHVGVVELGEFPLGDGYDGDDRGYLDRHVESFLADLRADRAVGCAHLDFAPEPTAEVEVGGVPGLRTGFTMTDVAGEVLERHVVYVAVHGGALFVVTAAAYDDGACLERLGEFLVTDLDEVREPLDRIVADTQLPDPTPPPADGLADGGHVARIVSIDAPVSAIEIDLAEMLTGEEAVAAARADGEIGPDEDLPNDFYVRDLDDTVHHVGIDDDAVVALIDCNGGCQPVEVALSDFLVGKATPFNGEFALYEITVTGGRVSAITEIYLP
jgi:hypothetical protein